MNQYNELINNAPDITPLLDTLSSPMQSANITLNLVGNNQADYSNPEEYSTAFASSSSY